MAMKLSEVCMNIRILEEVCQEKGVADQTQKKSFGWLLVGKTEEILRAKGVLEADWTATRFSVCTHNAFSQETESLLLLSALACPPRGLLFHKKQHSTIVNRSNWRRRRAVKEKPTMISNHAL